MKDEGKRHKNSRAGGGAGVLYYIQAADGFGDGVLGVLNASSGPPSGVRAAYFGAGVPGYPAPPALNAAQASLIRSAWSAVNMFMQESCV
jgi:hypothetical protein